MSENVSGFMTTIPSRDWNGNASRNTKHATTVLHSIPNTNIARSTQSSSSSSSTTTTTTTPTTTHIHNKPKIIIIGAGFSGLSVAYHLQKNPLCQNWEIDILEARDRVGGRVHTHFHTHTDETNDTDIKTYRGYVELGGQWIHEANFQRNEICQLCEDLGIKVQDDYQRQKKVSSTKAKMNNNISNDNNVGKDSKLTDTQRKVDNVFDGQTGKKIPIGLTQDTTRYFYKAMEEEFDKMSNDGMDEMTSFQRSLDDQWKFLTQRRRGGQGINEREEHRLMTCVWHYLKHKVECYEGGRVDELSVLLSEMYENKGGPDKLPIGGYGAVLEKLVQTLTKPKDESSVSRTRLHLNSPVTSIAYQTTMPSMCDDVSGVQVHLANESILTADFCICTVPLGVLQRKMINFSPILPPYKVKAIDTIGMGILNKVVLIFESCFWNDLCHFGISDAEDASLTKSFVDCSLPSDNYFTLILFLGGSAARRIDPHDNNGNGQSTTRSDTEAIDDAMTSLRKVFGENIPSPLSSHVTRWGSDPFAYGSYSFAKVGSSETTYDDMISPIGSLLFAGEHTSKESHSTVHGAWETGRREAERLLSFVS